MEGMNVCDNVNLYNFSSNDWFSLGSEDSWKKGFTAPPLSKVLPCSQIREAPKGFFLYLLCLKCLQVFFFISYLFWLCWVFIAVCRLSLVEATLHCGARASHCGGLCCRAQTLGAGASVGAARGLSCSEANGIFWSQGSNPCPLHW